MDNEVSLALIAVIPGTIAAIGAMIVGIMNHQKLTVVKHQTDGMLTKMESSAFKDGKDEGKRAEQANPTSPAQP